MNRAEYMMKPFEDYKDLINDRVASGIETNRKGRKTLKVVDANGEAIVGAKLRLTQRTHDFHYGANIFMLDEFETAEKNAIYRDEFKKYFNLATLPFYWGTLEPEEGKPRFAKDSPKVYRRPAPDLCLEYCEENGIAPKEHCLHYDIFSPSWLTKYPVEMQWKILERRMRECAERYSTRIHGWEVTNESWWKRCATQMYMDHEFVERSFKMAEQYFPQNELIINEGGEMFSEQHFYYTRNNYFMQVERALLKGARIDTIGMQYHLWCNPDNEAKIAYSQYSPKKVFDVLDTFWNAFHKPMQITEITCPCHDPESREAEDIQAEVIKNIYSMFFSHPAMEAIIYWNLVDGYAHGAKLGDFSNGENKLSGGLMRFDMTPKPAAKMLHKLFNEEWHTDVEVVTDEGGCASFKGFYGNYDVEIITGNTSCKREFHLVKGEHYRDTYTLTVK